MPGAAQAEHHGDPYEGDARARRDGQGHHPGASSARIGVGGRHRPRRRVSRSGDRGADDGRPHDDLQHDDRGRRARGHDRARRDDVRVPQTDGRSRRRTRSWDTAVAYWRTLPTDDDAEFDRALPRRHEICTAGHLGHQSRHGALRSPRASRDREFDTGRPRGDGACAAVHGICNRAARCDRPVDVVFIGSCTNGAPRDLRAAAQVVRGRKVAARRRTRWSCPAPAVKAQAEAEGLRRDVPRGRLRWREPGCSMCLGMNGDKVAPGERSLEHQQPQLRRPPGRGARTHLSGPAMAAAAADRGGISPTSAELGGTMNAVTNRQARGHLDRADVDTDQIMPKQFLKRVERTGFGEFRVLRLGQASPAGSCRPTRSWSRARTSAVAPRASTRRGRCRTTAFRRSSHRASLTSSTPTALKNGLLPVVLDEEDCRALAHRGLGRGRPARAGGPLRRARRCL